MVQKMLWAVLLSTAVGRGTAALPGKSEAKLNFRLK